jgi:hypothetical protein
VWADRPKDLMQHLPRPEHLPPDVDLPRPISVTFIPAKMFDNPALLQVNPKYFAWLLSLPQLERERLLGGNWKIRPAARPYFKREWCTIVEEAPADLDVACYWDLTATEKTRFDSTTPIGRSASSSAATGMAATGCSIWCAGGRTRATSKNCCSTSPRRTAHGSASGLAKTRGRPVKVRGFICPGAQWIQCNAEPRERRQGYAVRAVQFAVPCRQRED